MKICSARPVSAVDKSWIKALFSKNAPMSEAPLVARGTMKDMTTPRNSRTDVVEKGGKRPPNPPAAPTLQSTIPRPPRVTGQLTHPQDSKGGSA